MSHLQRLIVSDEALMESPLEVAPSGGAQMPPYERLVALSRYTRTGFLGAAQALSPLPVILKSNIATVVCLPSRSVKEAREAAAMLGGPDDRTHEILHLSLPYGFVRSLGFDGHVKVWLPDFPLGAYPSDAEVERQLAAERQWLTEQTVYSSGDSDEAAALDVSAILGEQEEPVAAEPVTIDDATRAGFLHDHYLLLQDIESHPQASVTEHYHRNLSWSAWRGNRTKNQLMEMGLIRMARQKSANGRPRAVLSLTEKGRKILDEHKF